VILKRAYMGRYRRLSDVQIFRGGRKSACSGHGVESFEPSLMH
jgi:hypothetical protein